MNPADQRSDEDLANLLAQGDPAAGSALLQRYAPGIHDFAIRVSLDPYAAANVTENTLRRSIERIAELPGTLSFRGWIYGLARDEALEGMRQRVRPESSQDELQGGVLPPSDARFSVGPDGRAEEALQWAWQAARGQRPRDYSILDLALRRQLPPEEIAEIASLSRNGVYAVLGRLRGAFEESFVASALYYAGRRQCEDLAGIIGDVASVGPAARREIGRHSEACPICRQLRDNLPAAADLFAAVTDFELSGEAEQRLAGLVGLLGAASADELAPSVAAPDAPTYEPETSAFSPAEQEENVDEGARDADAGLAATAGLSVAADSVEDLKADADARAASQQSLFEEEAPEEQSAELEEREQLEGEVEEDFEPGSEIEAVAAPPLDEFDRDFEPEVPEPAAIEPAGLEEEDYAAEEDETLEEPPEQARRGALLAPPLGAGVAASFPREDERALREDARAAAAVGGAAGVPPRGPLWESDDGAAGESPRSRLLLFALIGGLTLIAAFLGIVVANWLSGDDGDGGASVAVILPTPVAGVPEVACGLIPVSIDQAASVALVFSEAPSNFTISGEPGVRAISSEASVRNVSVLAQGNDTVLFTALIVANSAGRVDEYGVSGVFAGEDGERLTSECLVNVEAGGLPSATATPAHTSTPAPSVESEATPTPTIAVEPIATPTVEIFIPVPPTQTPVPEPTETPVPLPTETPTPSGPTPTFTPQGPTSTPTATGTPATPTATIEIIN